MNIYFRAVGFSTPDSMTSKHAKKQIIEGSNKKFVDNQHTGKTYMEALRMCGDGIGIMIKGNITHETEDYEGIDIIPYAVSTHNTNCLKYDVDFDESFEDQSIMIYYQEENFESELTFLLQEEVAFKSNKEAFIAHGQEDKIFNKEKMVNVSALSIDGTVVLPTFKNELSDELQKIEEDYVKHLINRLKSGDLLAEELLKSYEEETTELIRERLHEEDFLTVIESYFMPEDENAFTYSLLGTIEDFKEITNSATGEIIYKLLVDVTGIKLQLYINKQDLVGVPSKSMRFLGSCRLQGNVLYTNNKN